MSQRVILGKSTGAVIGVVRQHGSRVECIGLVPWMVPQTLDHIGEYWLGGFNTKSTPESAVLESWQ